MIRGGSRGDPQVRMRLSEGQAVGRTRESISARMRVKLRGEAESG